MPYTLKQYEAFQQAYEGESDRSVVILAASFIERALEEYIRKKLVDEPTVSKLFDGYAPLATMAAKIDMAFAIGLLPKHVYEDLRLIKKLRNLLAHEPKPLSFASTRVSDLCSNFSKIKRSDGTVLELKSGRAQFLNGVFFSILHIEAETARITRSVVPKFHIEEVVDDPSAA